MSRHPKYFQAHFCSFQETPLASKTLFIPLPELLKHPHLDVSGASSFISEEQHLSPFVPQRSHFISFVGFFPHFILLGIMAAIHSDGARFSQFVDDGQEGEIKSKSNLKRSRKCHKLVRK